MPLRDARAAILVRALKHGGMRVEALIDEPDPCAAIREVISFNEGQPPESRIDGIHYDYEPWTKTEAWVAPLLAIYARAHALAASGQLPFAVDFSAVKLAHLSQSEQHAIADAVSRIVLMAYEAPAAVVHKRAAAFLAERKTTSAEWMVAVRVKDFAATALSPAERCPAGNILSALDAAYGGKPGYAGWALYDYNTTLDARYCPVECCLR